MKQKQTVYRIREFATLAGVTVRALHPYDRLIGQAEQSVRSSREPDWDLFKTIVREIEMQNSTEWSKKYYSEDAKAKIEGRKGLWSPELQVQVTRQWSELVADVEAALSEDPGSPKAQALAARWRKLVEGFTGGDPEIRTRCGRTKRTGPPRNVRASRSGRRFRPSSPRRCSVPRSSYELFGADHVVFATDTPYDNQFGERVTRETIDGVRAMPIDEPSKRKIFADNARRLFRLPV